MDLKTEFIDNYIDGTIPEVYLEMIADWWLSKFSQKQKAIRERIETSKRYIENAGWHDVKIANSNFNAGLTRAIKILEEEGEGKL